MIGLDTNVLLRYYIDDDADAATLRQRAATRELIESGTQLAVAQAVLLEMEWIMRGYYRLARAEILAILRHLMSLPQVNVHGRATVQHALENYSAGFEFADALHHANYRDCSEVASFDDRGFARRAAKWKLQPRVRVAGAVR